MGKLWCRDVPIVTVPVGAEPKSLTLVMPFYMNHAFLAQQIEAWRSYPGALRPWLSVILVDDGSPRPMAEALRGVSIPVSLLAYRIDVDVRWNWLAARNIGATHAPQGWMLLTDMDHVLPAETLQALVYGQHDPGVVYAFSRREHTGEVVNPHSASFFMTRTMFWQIGGYDERLSGFYGTDGVYRAEVARHAPMRLLRDHLVRYEYVADSSTTAYQRKQPEDAAVKRLVAARPRDWAPKVLSFPYSEVTL